MSGEGTAKQSLFFFNSLFRLKQYQLHDWFSLLFQYGIINRYSYNVL